MERGTHIHSGRLTWDKGTVNACEGYKIATSQFLPSLVHFVRGNAAWAVPCPTAKTAIEWDRWDKGTVPCPTKKTANESHSHGARSKPLPAPFLLLFPGFRPATLSHPALIRFTLKRIIIYLPCPHFLSKNVI